MHRPASIFIGAGAALLLASLLATPAVYAQGSAPSAATCEDKANPPTDPVVQGGCVSIDRRKGNCHSCHMMQGINYGNVAPPLIGMKARGWTEEKLRNQVWDASKANPNTVMPPFGRHGILSDDEVNKVAKFLLTL